MKRLAVAVTLACSAVSACSADECEGPLCASERKKNNPDDEGEAARTCTDTAAPHVGLGGEPLNAGRLEGKVGQDRARAKPYEVLATDYARVLGTTPASMAKLGPTFGASPARWHTEPRPSAVTMSSALLVAFEGCLELTKTDAQYEGAPEESTALAACSAMARRFWSRVVAPEDVQGCVDVAMIDSVKETYATGPNGEPVTTTTTPRRRWAYACTSLLTSTQFLAY